MTKQEFLEFSLSKDLKLWQSCKYWAVPVLDRVVTLTGIGDTDGKLPMQYNNEIAPTTIFYRLDGSTTGTDYITNVKPICRPLSDLTKPIEHKGETFIPIVKIAEILGYENISLKGNDCQVGLIESGSSYIKETLRYTDNYFYIDVEDYYYSSDSVKQYKDGIFMDHFQLFQKLIKWHFDLADLISKGEAIDVNTLDVNPYK